MPRDEGNQMKQKYRMGNEQAQRAGSLMKEKKPVFSPEWEANRNDMQRWSLKLPSTAHANSPNIYLHNFIPRDSTRMGEAVQHFGDGHDGEE